jgi:phage shock protein C
MDRTKHISKSFNYYNIKSTTMQRIIQITIGGRVIPIEELAYAKLSDYIDSLERQFATEEGKDEIILDIETRIAELFATKLESGAHAIDQTDVQMVIGTLGNASELEDEPLQNRRRGHTHHQYNAAPPPPYDYTPRRLYRNPYDRILGGVCSGIANYFDIDTVLVRLIFAILFFTVGIGLLAYILAWIIVPAARTPQEFQYMTGAPSPSFENIKKNMGEELQGLKKKSEEMSKELKEFFSKKK